MTFTVLRFRPGIDVEQTPVLLEAGWSEGQNIRFPHGLPEKIGGWVHINESTVTGTCRGTQAWADLAGNPYIAVGTEQRLQVYTLGNLYDITPLRQTDNVTSAFSTTQSNIAVKVHDAGHGAATGDYVNIPIPVAVGSLIIQGMYPITVIDGNNYNISAASIALATVNSGGVVPEFTTTSGSANITVTLPTNGYVSNTPFTVQVPLTVGGISLTPAYVSYNINSVANANNFVIAPGATATASSSAFENSGQAQLEYLISQGYSSVVALTGYGIGPYGSGAYGGSNSSVATVYSTLRIWSLDNFGQDLIGNYTKSPIYIWVPPPAGGNVALAINTTNFSAIEPPTAVNWSFVAMPQEIVVALGCDPYSGTQDPCLIRWSDAGNYLAWQALATNQAGSFRLPNGSMIIGGIQAPQFACIWTDIEMWTMTYLGFPFVFGFQKIGAGVDLIAPNAACVLNGQVYWASSNAFFVFDGNSMRSIPCPVWDVFWQNLNRQQRFKIFAGANSYFREVSWWFPSASGNGEIDSRITLNTDNGTWTYDFKASFVRTCWQDENVYGAPYGTDLSGYIQQHEQGYDADGSPLMAYALSGFAQISEGTEYALVERLLGDAIVTGGTSSSNNVYIGINVKNYTPQSAYTYGPYAFNPSVGVGPKYSVVRARGRYAQVEISSADMGVFWRLGGIHLNLKKAGRR